MDAARRITQLADWLAGTDIAMLELTTPDLRIRLGRNAPSGDAATTLATRAAATTAASDGHPTDRPAASVVEAHSVGVFLDAHPLATAPLAAVGARVVAGQTVGLLRIGALLLPVTAPADAVVERVLATPGEAVGHGTPLFALN